MGEQKSALTSISENQTIIVGLGSFCMAIFLINYYYKFPGISDVAGVISNIVPSIEWLAMLMGATQMMKRQIGNVMKRKGSWYIDAVCTSTILIMIASFLYGGQNDPIHVFFINVPKAQGMAAMFALHGFFVISASMRVFKFRNVTIIGSIIMMFIMILFQAPIGEVIWPGFAPLGDWLTRVVLASGSRAIITGGAVGATVLGLRLFLGYDRGMYGFRRKK